MDREPFGSVEDALEFLGLLEEAIRETQVDLQEDLAGASADTRRRDGLILAAHKLERLGFHVKKSRRLANDLRILRRVLLPARSADVAVR